MEHRGVGWLSPWHPKGARTPCGVPSDGESPPCLRRVARLRLAHAACVRPTGRVLPQRGDGLREGPLRVPYEEKKKNVIGFRSLELVRRATQPPTPLLSEVTLRA